MLRAVRAGERWCRGGLLAGIAGDRGAIGIDAKFDHEVEHHRNWIAILGGRLERGLANGVNSILIEAETDGSGYGDLARLAIGADYDVIEADAGYAVVLRELV